MSEIWLISDTHFFHENILRFTIEGGDRLRPFNDITEMHETIIRKWNMLVAPTDHVYHLGDVTFDYGKKFNELMYALNGKKRLTVGNHDHIYGQKGMALGKHFEKIMLWRGFREEELTMSHMPLKEGHFRDGRVNVHGHTHWNLVPRPYINVCVERRDYSPVHLDTIKDEAKEIIKDLENRDKINRNLNKRLK